jgi:hypothetical protein
MSDEHDSTQDTTDEHGDGWVEPNGTGRSGRSIRRVPGLYAAPDATYKPRERVPLRRRSVVLAGAIVLVALVVFGGLVAAADTKRTSDDDAELSAAATLTSSSTRPPSSTTTISTAPTGSGSTSEASGTTGGTLPTTGGSSSSGSTTGSGDTGGSTVVDTPAAPAPAPPPPPVTANPGLPPYQRMNVPAGVSATLSGCTWVPDNGGELRSAGTITSHDGAARTWNLTMVWLQNDRVLASQNAAVTLPSGATQGWGLVIAAPNPPAQPFSCALEIR